MSFYYIQRVCTCLIHFLYGKIWLEKRIKKKVLWPSDPVFSVLASHKCVLVSAPHLLVPRQDDATKSCYVLKLKLQFHVTLLFKRTSRIWTRSITYAISSSQNCFFSRDVTTTDAMPMSNKHIYKLSNRFVLKAKYKRNTQ